MASKSEGPNAPANLPPSAMDDPANSNTSQDVTECNESEPNLGTPPSPPADMALVELPAELLIHICSFLEAKFVHQTLSKVCRLLSSLVTSSTFWKVRIKKRFPKKYPAIPVNDDAFDWREACVEREEKHRLWSKSDENLDYFHYSSGMFASVDAVHLMRNGSFLATGSRDRYMHLLDLDKLESGNPDSVNSIKSHVEMDAHAGWIWTIDSVDNTLATGSWDAKVKFWDLEAGCTFLHQVKLKSAVLCSHFEANFLAVGSYDKKIYHIDPRQPESILRSKYYHRKPVLCLAADDRFIITGSEDSMLKVYDRRGEGVVKSLKFESYPMSMSYRGDQLWVGEKDGSLNLVDASDGDFSLVEKYDVGSKGKLTGVIHTPGAIFTSSTDSAVTVLEPTQDPGVIAKLSKENGEVASIALQNDVLAQANSNISVGIWKPKS